MSERYSLVSDNDGHEYVIPNDKRYEFERWLNEEADDGGSEPDWAQRIEGGSLTFTDPEYY